MNLLSDVWDLTDMCIKIAVLYGGKEGRQRLLSQNTDKKWRNLCSLNKVKVCGNGNGIEVVSRGTPV